jgi:hypothetical protein
MGQHFIVVERVAGKQLRPLDPRRSGIEPLPLTQFCGILAPQRHLANFADRRSGSERVVNQNVLTRAPRGIACEDPEKGIDPVAASAEFVNRAMRSVVGDDHVQFGAVLDYLATSKWRIGIGGACRRNMHKASRDHIKFARSVRGFDGNHAWHGFPGVQASQQSAQSSSLSS